MPLTDPLFGRVAPVRNQVWIPRANWRMINSLDGNCDRAGFTQPEDMVMARSVEETTFCQLSKKMLKNEMETYVRACPIRMSFPK